MPVDEVLSAARTARDQGATRFCMGAAWRNPTDKNLEQVVAMVEGVHGLGLETCVTLGMLTAPQARRLKDAGLDYYNHNLDTSPEFYGQVITTRTFQDRLDTLEHIRTVGLKTCSGGILGMGESRRDRASMLRQLANLPAHPESVPINLLVRVEGTPLEDSETLDPFELVRVIAAARILMPSSYVRLSAGRSEMSDELQALCYLAGANSIFYGDRLLTTPNTEADRDRALFARLGLAFEEMEPERNEPGVCHKTPQPAVPALSI
jgi:biotin synthase